MKYMRLFAVTTLALSLQGISAANAADGAALFKEKTCIACHGAEGKKPLLPIYPKLAGQNKDYIKQQMMDIKSGARANGQSAAMKGIMHLVSDEDIEALSDYLSKLTP